MQSITHASRDTNKKCSSCNGSILEFFSEKIDTSAPRSYGWRHRNTFISSDGYGCTECGLQYGGPVFFETEPSKELLFQFSLRTVSFTKKITKDDIAPIITYKQIPVEGAGEKGSIFPKGATVNGKMKVTPIKNLPKAFANSKAGDTVYLLSEEAMRRDMKLPLWGKYIQIQLSKDLGAEKFLIKIDCIK